MTENEASGKLFSIVQQPVLFLRIDKIVSEGEGKCYALLDPRDMRILGVNKHDVIEIGGRKKTAVRAMPLLEPSKGNSIIQIDSITMDNARAEVDDRVLVKKIEAKPAIKVVLAPLADEMLCLGSDTALLLPRIQGFPVTAGDKVSIPISEARSEEFQVLGTVPADTVIIGANTKIEIRKKPTGKVDSSRVTYNEIGGLREQIKKVREMVELPLKYPQVFERLGVDPPRGILLVGPPGSGKTLLARAVANETGANFQVVNGPEIMHKYYGESEAKLRAIFENATRNQPSIIFLDELDAIAPKRERVSGDVEKRVVAQLLALMDGLRDRGKVVVIGSTNLPRQLDPALRRPGRFDREIVLDVPNRNGRLEILHIHTRGMPLHDDVDLEKIADLTHGFVGADIQNLCREAAMKALRDIMPEIDLDRGAFPFDDLSTLRVNLNHFLAALRDIEPSAVREIFVEIPKVTWEDVGGHDEIKEVLTESVVWPLMYKDLFQATRTKPPKGILLYGLPGTGKTLIAKALANESGVNFISVKGAELLSKYVGESEQRIKEIFRKARQVAPCILFFDEIDALAPSRRNAEGERVSERVVSQILTEMDGVEELNGVLILAATNRIDMVDPALLRAGRFDMFLEVKYPDEKSTLEILKIHTRGKPLAKDVKLEEIARNIHGFSGADIELLCHRASVIAIRRHLEKRKGILKITQSHFHEALKEASSKSILSPSRLKPRNPSLRTGNNQK